MAAKPGSRVGGLLGLLGVGLLGVPVTASATGVTVTKLVPIVLDVAGSGGSRYTTELVLSNRGTTAATAQLTYTPATSLGATGRGSASVDLPAGAQVLIPDAIAWLRGKGLSIPVGSNQGGTLGVAFSGLSSPDAAYVGARTTTPSGPGRAGLSYSGIDLRDAATGTSFLYGLRSSSSDRTNLALANAGTASVTLRVTLFSGAAGDSRTYVVSPDTTLAPGQWTQIGRVLDLGGITNGYAEVGIVSGSGPYVAYAIFNDNTTNDGSYVAAVPATLTPETQLVPALVESASYQTELVLTNPLPVPETAVLRYVESASPGSGAGGSLALSFQPGEQKIIPSAIDYLRQNGVALGPKGPTYAGALSVTFMNGPAVSTGFAGARTASPAGGTGPGEYGLFYPAVGTTSAAAYEAWVHGLQQTASKRTNLAVANLGDGGDAVTFRVDVFDGSTGRPAGSTAPVTLAPGGWAQLNAVLQPFGVAGGYARVVKLSGDSRFVAYAVVNDGGAPGQGTSDGSYVGGLPAPPQIASISVCSAGGRGGAGSCPAGTFDTHEIVLAPDGSGNAINTYDAGFASDEHSSVFAPGTLGDNRDYVFFVASGTKLVGHIGAVALSGGAGPNANGQWTFDVPRTDGYGKYASGFGNVFVAPTSETKCPTVVDGNPAHQDQTFDLNYAAPGSVVLDPSSGPGRLLMVYEGVNTCTGTTGGGRPGGGDSYLSTGVATSVDWGRTWPTYRGASTFGFVPPPDSNGTQGPNAPTGALGMGVCMGDDCASTPPAAYGRYAVLSPSVSLATLMSTGQPLTAFVGEGAPSAFVDDASPGSAPSLYVVYGHNLGPGEPPLPNNEGTDLMLARAPLNGGSARLEFLKWNGQAVAAPGLGGSDSPILPTGGFVNCGAASQGRVAGSIGYVESTQQYLLLFVCNSPGDPSLGHGGTRLGSAWFYSATRDLSDPAAWSAPREITGTWSEWDTSTGCASYRGWYPTAMSPGAKPGHLSTSGYVFYTSGCVTGQGPPRQYSSRAFTIQTQP